MKKLMILLLALILTACSINPKDEPVPTGPVMEEPVEEKPQEENPFPLPDEFSPGRYRVEDTFPSVSFQEPLALVSDGVSDERIYVVERGGMVYFLNLKKPDSENTVYESYEAGGHQRSGNGPSGSGLSSRL